MNEAPVELRRQVAQILSFLETNERVFSASPDDRERRFVLEQALTRRWVAALGPWAGEAVLLLATTLRVSTAGERMRAARALGLVGGDATVAALVGALADKEPIVRISAAEACSFLGREGVRVVYALNRTLRDENRQVRFEAALALAHLDHTQTEVLSHLAEALSSGSHARRWRAAQALGEMGSAASSIIPSLLRAITVEDSRPGKALLRAVCMRVGGPWVSATLHGM